MVVDFELSHYGLFYHESMAGGGGSTNYHPNKMGGIAKSQALILGGIAKYTG